MARELQHSATVGAQLALAERTLAAAGVTAPRVEALELLSAVLAVPAALLSLRGRAHVSPLAAETFAGWVARRAAGEAIPYVTGHLAFMELDVVVDRSAPLVPPYAARLVEIALACARRDSQHDVVAAELETGCGAIALALAAFEPRFARIYALDPGAAALRTAAANGARYLLNLVVTWLPGEGLDAVPERVDLLVRARCGAADSSRFAELIERASTKLRAGGALICGLDPGEAEPAEAAVLRALPDAEVWADAQSDGVVLVAQVPHAALADAARLLGRPG